MKTIIKEIYEVYKALNCDLYIGLNDPEFIEYSDEKKIIIGYEDLGGDYIYVDLVNSSNNIMMDSDFGAMKIFNNIKELKEFINTILVLKTNNSSFEDENALNTYMIENIDTYVGTDENLLISVCNYLKL
ncbi:MAG: hypothetical protein ACRC68_03655 [Clostridium sp.]